MRRPRLFLNSILGVVIAAGACSSGDAPTGPSADLGNLINQVGQVVDNLVDAITIGDYKLPRCDVLPAARDSAQIGPKGGTLAIGPHKLVVPAGSLSNTVWIRGELGTTAVNSVKFGPEGLRFARGATLTMSYANCKLESKRLRFVYTNNALTAVLEALSADVSKNTKSLSGTIQHFSQYAVAY